MTDWDLLQRYARANDAEAMCELVRRHSGLVHAAALRQVRDGHLADDITQAVFLVLMRRAKDIKPNVILSGWLFKTTLYAAADARAKRATRVRHEREVSRMDIAPEAASPLPLAADELTGALNDALARLSAPDRDAVVLRYLQGQSTAQVAAALGTSEPTARQRLSRALERLRKNLARLGVITAAAALLTLLDGLSAHAAPGPLVEQMQNISRGSAAASPLSQTLAQGVIRMERQARITRNSLLTAAAAAAILALCLPLALAQTAANPARVDATVPSSPFVAPVAPVAQVTQANTSLPVASPTIPAPAQPAPAISPAAALKSTVDSNTAFAADLYQVLLKSNADKNLFISPYSISTILGLTAAGARGNTAAEMNKVLHISDMNTLNAGIAELSRQLADTEGGQRPYKLSIANSLWDSARYPMTPSFTALAAKYYNTSGIFMTDFRADPEAARKKINLWVEDKTNAKIKDLLPAWPPSITKATALVLVNAIYFKGTWQTQFIPQQTKTEPFHISAANDAPASLMRVGGNWQYYENDQFQMVSLPYTAARVPGKGPLTTSLLVILPRKFDGLAELEASLTPENLALWITRLKSRSGQVILPKFTITCPLDLLDPLQSLGMQGAFNPGGANFRDLATPPPGENIWISGVFHKAFIDVNEEGTEAAAATAVVARAGGGRPLDPFTFRADHPFFFAIRYEPANSILFMGHLIEPAAPGNAPSPAQSPPALNPARGPAPRGTARGPVELTAEARLQHPKAAAALDLVIASRADAAFVSPARHGTLFTDLRTLESAATAAAMDAGTDPAATERLNAALSQAIDQAVSRTDIIAARSTETPQDQAKARQLGEKLRALGN